jgi:hypothetical protein
MDIQLYSDALGLALLQQANRFVYWTPAVAHWLLLSVTVGGALLLLAPRFLGNRTRVASVLAAALGVLVLGWNLTGQISASAGTNSLAREAATTLGRPFDWVDRVAQRKPTLYLGQGISDQNPQWMMEFWNRSIVSVSSLDGTVGGPGPAGGPNLLEDGTTYWTAEPSMPGPVYDYAVEEWPCVDFAGRVAATHSYRAGGSVGGGNWRLIELTHPNRLQAMCVGISPDGWTGPADSGYFRFSGGEGGTVEVTISREKSDAPAPSPVHVLVGTLTINANHQPEFGRVTGQQTVPIDHGQKQVVRINAPGPRFAVRVVVERKFVPDDYDHKGDRRQLGAVVSYRFVRQAATK